MSWNQQPQQSGYYNSGPPPPQGYGAPPNQYGQSQGYPGGGGQQYGGYAPPPQGPPQGQGYGAPMNPNQNQGYMQPGGMGMQQGYDYRGSSPQPPYGFHSPQAPYGAPYGAPPQQSPYGYNQNQSNGAPPHQQQQQQQQQYAPQVQQAPPSPGYDPNFIAPVDTSHQADALRTAMKGLGTNEALLITTLTNITDPYIMSSVRQTFHQRHHRNLLADLKSETSGYFCETLEALARGPLAQDVHLLHTALSGLGTKESVLNDILLGRSNADLAAIKTEYHRTHHRTLESDVRGDLSLKTERMFMMVLSADRAPESSPIIPHQLDADVTELHRATEAKMGTEELSVCNIFSHRSSGQLRAISHEYTRRYARPLSKVVEGEFSGHMQDALLRMLGVAEDRAMADAEALEATMRGAGTKDRLLVNRVVRLHWERGHLGQVRGAYRKRYGKELGVRVRGETRGDYQKVLCAIVES